MNEENGRMKPGLAEFTNESGARFLQVNPWHRAYCKWYDHDRAGHKIRAAIWGWVSDRLVK